MWFLSENGTWTQNVHKSKIKETHLVILIIVNKTITVDLKKKYKAQVYSKMDD